MENLSWGGVIGDFFAPAFLSGLFAMVLVYLVAIIINPFRGEVAARFYRLGNSIFWFLLVIAFVTIIGSLFLSGVNKGIIGQVVVRFWPVWLAILAMYTISIMFKSRLGLYGRLFDSTIGMFGLTIVMFWLFTAIFAPIVATYPPTELLMGIKFKPPGFALPDGSGWALFGGDHLSRDVFSRMVYGAQDVMKIAPFATLFAFMMGILLGLPAGYFGGKWDTFLSFLANLILSFPVILLFFLLVTPEIQNSAIPRAAAAVLFLFPIIFAFTLVQTRFFTQPTKMYTYLAIILVIGFWVYFGLVFDMDPLGIFSMTPNLLNVFIAVVFVNSPTVFRIVRGLTLDIKSRDYVAAAQTRGESPWYIMLWEILPNSRGPLIVDFCLRIGYTTILLGTLGFFGLGVSPESPDWGSTINEGRKLLTTFPHPAIVPALALMSLVLGLNLLADGLREESLKD